MAKTATDPFNAETEAPAEEGVEEYDETTVQFESEPVTLADAAASAFGENLEGLSGTQEELDGTDYTKAKFVGMSFDSLDREIHIGDEITFVVRARCLGEGTEASKTDGRVRKYVKMDVQSVVVKEDSP